MPKLKPSIRLALVGVILVESAVYGVLISYNPRIASAVMLGYIAVLLSLMVVIHVSGGKSD